jgi:hypothetical protein
MTHKSLCFAQSALEMGHLLTFEAEYQEGHRARGYVLYRWQPMPSVASIIEDLP